MHRAHLHAGGMGTTVLGMVVLLHLLGTSRRLLIRAGVGLGYSIFWMWAGFRAPGLGSIGATKESLKWLAMTSSDAFVLSTSLRSRPQTQLGWLDGLAAQLPGNEFLERLERQEAKERSLLNAP